MGFRKRVSKSGKEYGVVYATEKKKNGYTNYSGVALVQVGNKEVKILLSTDGEVKQTENNTGIFINVLALDDRPRSRAIKAG